MVASPSPTSVTPRAPLLLGVPPDPPRRGAPAGRLAAAVVALWAVVATSQLTLAYLDARRGEKAAQDALGELSAEVLLEGRTTSSLERAHRSLAAARRRAGGVVLAPVRLAPVAGRQLRSFTALAGAAEQVVGAGRQAVDDARAALAGGDPGGPDRLRLLSDLQRVVTHSRSRLEAVDLGPDRDLLGPLAARRAELSRRLADARATLERSSHVIDTLARVLGGGRRYLFLAGNNAEMRAGSGMFLEAGVLEARGGRLSLGPLRPTSELTLPGEGVPSEGDLAARWGWLRPGREWRNLGLSPRFDITGPLATRMWASLTGERVDGVLAVDVEALRAVLAGAGPVPVEGGSMGEADVVERLLHDQYVDFGHDHAARRDQLGQIAAAAMAAMDRGHYDIGRLVDGLASAARGRHVLAWAADDADQRGWKAAGLTGELGPSSLLVAVVNRGGNKLDRFLETHNHLEVRPGPDGREVVLRVRLRNTTPLGEPPYVSGPHPDSGVGEGTYLGVVSVNVPGEAADVRVDGSPPLVASGPDGPTTVLATPVVLLRGEEKVVVVRFRLPASSLRLRVEPSARLPPVPWQHGRARWSDLAPRTVHLAVAPK